MQISLYMICNCLKYCDIFQVIGVLLGDTHPYFLISKNQSLHNNFVECIHTIWHKNFTWNLILQFYG